jgi:hypothetical protein
MRENNLGAANDHKEELVVIMQVRIRMADSGGLSFVQILVNTMQRNGVSQDG